MSENLKLLSHQLLILQVIFPVSLVIDTAIRHGSQVNSQEI